MGPHLEKKNKTFDVPHFDLFGSDQWTKKCRRTAFCEDGQVTKVVRSWEGM